MACVVLGLLMTALLGRFMLALTIEWLRCLDVLSCLSILGRRCFVPQVMIALVMVMMVLSMLSLVAMGISVSILAFLISGAWDVVVSVRTVATFGMILTVMLGRIVAILDVRQSNAEQMSGLLIAVNVMRLVLVVKVVMVVVVEVL